jgi:hypothetical protein
MGVKMKAKDVLTFLEARRNPTLNPKESLEQVLKKYRFKNYFVHFSGKNRIGVNPKYPASYENPAGVYAYPIKEVYETFAKTMKFPEKFALDRPYVFIIKPTFKGKFMNTWMYDGGDFARDVKYLSRNYRFEGEGYKRKLVKGKNPNPADMEAYLYQIAGSPANVARELAKGKNFFKLENTPDFMSLWKMTKQMAKELTSRGGNRNAKWNGILRELGYGVINENISHTQLVDLGIMLGLERYQALFLDADQYKVVETFKQYKPQFGKQRYARL